MPHPLHHAATRLVAQSLEALLEGLAAEAAYCFLRDGTLIALRGAAALPLSTETWRVRLMRARRRRVVALRQAGKAALTCGVTRGVVIAVVVGEPVSFRNRSLLQAECEELRRGLVRLLERHRRGSMQGGGGSGAGDSSWAATTPPGFRVN
jgi:hypothetical protein